MMIHNGAGVEVGGWGGGETGIHFNMHTVTSEKHNERSTCMLACTHPCMCTCTHIGLIQNPLLAQRDGRLVVWLQKGEEVGVNQCIEWTVVSEVKITQQLHWPNKAKRTGYCEQ